MSIGETFQLIALACGAIAGLIVLILLITCTVIDYVKKKKTINRIKERGKTIKIVHED
mgnify:CR=1 FL=1